MRSVIAVVVALTTGGRARVDIGTKPMKLTRTEVDGTVTTADIFGDDHGEGMAYFKVDADVEVGDELLRGLPNGKTRTFRITEVHVREAPRGFSSTLDHTECVYEVVNARTALLQSLPVALPGMHPQDRRSRASIMTRPCLTP
jgi:hypothetical protein